MPGTRAGPAPSPARRRRGTRAPARRPSARRGRCAGRTAAVLRRPSSPAAGAARGLERLLEDGGAELDVYGHAAHARAFRVRHGEVELAAAAGQDVPGLDVALEDALAAGAGAA